MLKTINVSGFTHHRRPAAVEELETAIRQGNGWIIDSRFFSQKSISMTLEVEYGDVEDLIRRLAEVARLDTPVREKLEEVGHLRARADEDIQLLLYFNFAQREADFNPDASPEGAD